MNPLFAIDRRPLYVLGFTGSDDHARGFWGPWAGDDDDEALAWLDDALGTAVRVLGYRRVVLHLPQGRVQGADYPAVLCGDAGLARRLPRMAKIVGHYAYFHGVEVALFTALLRGRNPTTLEPPDVRRRLPALGHDEDCAFRAVNEAPLLRAGCRAIVKDKSSAHPAETLNFAQEAAACGIKLIGEAVPTLPAGVHQLDPYTHYVRRMAWMAFAGYFHRDPDPLYPGVDPQRRWRLDPRETEVHCVFRPNDRGAAEATAANVADYRARGFVVGGHSGLSDQVHQAIVGGAADATRATEDST